MADDDTSYYHQKYLPSDTINFVINSTPFMPSIEPSEGFSNIWNVDFNQGYIFDWANGADRITVTNNSWTVGNGYEKFYINVRLDFASGQISEASISKNKYDDELYTNLRNLTTQSTGPNVVGFKNLSIPLAEFNGGQLIKLYVRENIHLWFRGFRQEGVTYTAEAQGYGAPLMVINDETSEFHSNETINNGLIKFRAIVQDPTPGNRLSISQTDDQILLYVSSAEGGS